MASVMQSISIAIGTSNTTLYDPFVDGTKERATVIDLELCNTTTADITVDIFIDKATDVYLADDLTVPAKGTAHWRGAKTIDDAAHILKAIASAVGVDCTGTVLESDV